MSSASAMHNLVPAPLGPRSTVVNSAFVFQLEAAMKTPNLSTDTKSSLDDAATKATEAMKKDDDAACHQAIADAMSKAGLTLK